MIQPFLPLEPTTWVEIKDGNPSALALYRRHYSCRVYRDGRKRALFVGPGEKLVLLSQCARALFVWRKFKCAGGQHGINCAVFRNEGAGLSSELIRQADELADERWPNERHYTFVNPRRVRSPNPGFCFMQAGWQRCGMTAWAKLLVLERIA